MDSQNYSFIKRIAGLMLSILLLIVASGRDLFAVERLPLYVKQNIAGAPQLLGVPFPVGKLFSPDHVRVINDQGEEIPSQITVVSNWEPAATSIKWIWVFFFSENSDSYERSEEHTSELQSLMRISYTVFCLKKKNNKH